MEIVWICSATFFVALGLIAFIRTVADSLFFPRQLHPAIILRTREDADLLEMLLHEARFAFFSQRATPIVLIGEELRGYSRLFGILEEKHIDYRWI